MNDMYDKIGNRLNSVAVSYRLVHNYTSFTTRVTHFVLNKTTDGRCSEYYVRRTGTSQCGRGNWMIVTYISKIAAMIEDRGISWVSSTHNGYLSSV